MVWKIIFKIPSLVGNDSNFEGKINGSRKFLQKPLLSKIMQVNERIFYLYSMYGRFHYVLQQYFSTCCVGRSTEGPIDQVEKLGATSLETISFQ